MSANVNKQTQISVLYYNNTLNYIGFFGKQTVFSNFYPTRLVYRYPLMNKTGLIINPRQEVDYYFHSAEHLYHWMKAMSNPLRNKCYMETPSSPTDGTICNSIRSTTSPGHAKYIGRKHVKITEQSWSLSNRVQSMRQIIALKFPSISLDNEHMPSSWDPTTVYQFNKEENVCPSVQLICTGNAHLIEMSPTDDIWGVGKSICSFELLLKNKSSTSIAQSMLLNNIYDIPIDIDIFNSNTEREFGLNLLGRILMEQRRKLQQHYQMLCNSIEEISYDH